MDNTLIELCVVMGIVIVGFGYLIFQTRAAQRDIQRMLDRMAEWKKQDELARAESVRFAKKFGQI